MYQLVTEVLIKKNSENCTFVHTDITKKPLYPFTSKAFSASVQKLIEYIYSYNLEQRSQCS